MGSIDYSIAHGARPKYVGYVSDDDDDEVVIIPYTKPPPPLISLDSDEEQDPSTKSDTGKGQCDSSTESKNECAKPCQKSNSNGNHKKKRSKGKNSDKSKNTSKQKRVSENSEQSQRLNPSSSTSRKNGSSNGLDSDAVTTASNDQSSRRKSNHSSKKRAKESHSDNTNSKSKRKRISRDEQSESGQHLVQNEGINVNISVGIGQDTSSKEGSNTFNNLSTSNDLNTSSNIFVPSQNAVLDNSTSCSKTKHSNKKTSSNKKSSRGKKSNSDNVKEQFTRFLQDLNLPPPPPDLGLLTEFSTTTPKVSRGKTNRQPPPPPRLSPVDPESTTDRVSRNRSVNEIPPPPNLYSKTSAETVSSKNRKDKRRQPPPPPIISNLSSHEVINPKTKKGNNRQIPPNPPNLNSFSSAPEKRHGNSRNNKRSSLSSPLRSSSEADILSIPRINSTVSELRNATSDSAFPPHWTDDMRKYYGTIEEAEFTLQSIMCYQSDNPKHWRVRTSLENKKHRRHPCDICHKWEHPSAYCPKRGIYDYCSYCGSKDHSNDSCTEKYCLFCGSKTDKLRKTCEKCLRTKSKPGSCTLCKVVGHNEKNCPDHWRRYHSTTVDIEQEKLRLEDLKGRAENLKKYRNILHKSSPGVVTAVTTDEKLNHLNKEIRDSEVKIQNHLNCSTSSTSIHQYVPKYSQYCSNCGAKGHNCTDCKYRRDPRYVSPYANKLYVIKELEHDNSTSLNISAETANVPTTNNQHVETVKKAVTTDNPVSSTNTVDSTVEKDIEVIVLDDEDSNPTDVAQNKTPSSTAENFHFQVNRKNDLTSDTSKTTDEPAKPSGEITASENDKIQQEINVTSTVQIPSSSREPTQVDTTFCEDEMSYSFDIDERFLPPGAPLPPIDFPFPPNAALTQHTPQLPIPQIPDQNGYVYVPVPYEQYTRYLSSGMPFYNNNSQNAMHID